MPTVLKNGKRDISNLTRELNLLRSFVIGLSGKDREGNYRPEFIKKILEAAQEKENSLFGGGTSFLSRLREK